MLTYPHTAVSLVIRRAALMLLLTALAVVGAAGAATAYNTPSYWNKSGTPLYKASYGSKVSAYGYVKMFNGSSGTRLYNYSYYKFTQADNHVPYLKGTSQRNSGRCGGLTGTVRFKGVSVGAGSTCANIFYGGANFARAVGSANGNAAWKALPTKSVAPNGGSDRGRGVFNLCLDVPLRADPCTGKSYSVADSF